MSYRNTRGRMRGLGSITSASVTSSPAQDPGKIDVTPINYGNILTTQDQQAIDTASGVSAGASAGGVASFLNTLFGGGTAARPGAAGGGMFSVGAGPNSIVPLLLILGVALILINRKKR